jgi:hypothetical protein
MNRTYFAFLHNYIFAGYAPRGSLKTGTPNRAIESNLIHLGTQI